MLSLAFCRVLRFEDGDESLRELFQAYYQPTYGPEYDEFWQVEHELPEGWEAMTLGEFFRTSDAEDASKDCNTERLYAFRISQIVEVVDKDKVIANARELYSNIGLTFYDSAFFGLTQDAILDELAEITRDTASR